uniref:Reverse transcriptase domain-containing protein n=1 Tax=Haemonchus contortus TaxID=6289 RepID=A0A7I4Z0M6_HAECO
MGVKFDGRYLHYLRFADDTVLITPNIEKAEQMLAEFDKACGGIDLRLNLTKTTSMKDGLVPDAPSRCTEGISLNALKDRLEAELIDDDFHEERRVT